MKDAEPLSPVIVWAVDFPQLLFFIVGAYLLAQQIVRERGLPPEQTSPWPARWVDFGLWICLVAFALSTGGMIANFFHPIAAGQTVSNYDTLIFGGVEQAVVLLTLVVLLKSRSVLSSAPVNQTTLPLGEVIRQGALAFLTAYPLIALSGQCWQLILERAQAWQPTLKLPEQAVVKLIENQPGLGEICLTVIFAVGLAPVTEELLFRAGLYRFLKSKFPTRVALGLVSLCFAAAHFNILQCVPLFVVGWMLARAYDRTGHVGVPIVFHALFNLNNIVMILLTSFFGHS